MFKLKKLFIIAVVALAVIASLLTTTYTMTLADRIEQVARSSHADMVYIRQCMRELENELSQQVIDRLCDRLEEISRPVIGNVAEKESDEDSAAASTETATDASPETNALPDEGITAPIPEGTAAESHAETDDTSREPVAESLPTASVVPPESDATADASSKPETESEAESETAAETEAVNETTDGESCTESETEADFTETDSMDLPTHNRPETETTPQEEPTTVLYTVAAYEGRIGVFDATGRLIRTVNVFLFSLPEADREALTVGIPAYTREEMVEIVGRYE